MTTQALHVDQLSVSYGTNPVLWDLSFQIPKGSLCCIVGPNGAGKSTLLKTILGQLTPVSGTLSIGDQQVAYVPQTESVDWNFPIRVIDLVLMGRYGELGPFRRVRRADRLAADEMLNRVGLSGLANRQIGNLSGGQQQRAFLARALMQRADLYLLDEPLKGIDAATEQVAFDIFKQLTAQGKTVCAVHHDLATVGRYFDWVLAIDTRLVGCGPVKEVFTSKLLEDLYGHKASPLEEVISWQR